MGAAFRGGPRVLVWENVVEEERFEVLVGASVENGLA